MSKVMNKTEDHCLRLREEKSLVFEALYFELLS